VHLDITKVSFIHQLMHQSVVLKTVLKFTLKFKLRSTTSILLPNSATNIHQ